MVGGCTEKGDPFLKRPSWVSRVGEPYDPTVMTDLCQMRCKEALHSEGLEESNSIMHRGAKDSDYSYRLMGSELAGTNGILE